MQLSLSSFPDPVATATPLAGVPTTEAGAAGGPNLGSGGFDQLLAGAAAPTGTAATGAPTAPGGATPAAVDSTSGALNPGLTTATALCGPRGSLLGLGRPTTPVTSGAGSEKAKPGVGRKAALDDGTIDPQALALALAANSTGVVTPPAPTPTEGEGTVPLAAEATSTVATEAAELTAAVEGRVGAAGLGRGGNPLGTAMFVPGPGANGKRIVVSGDANGRAGAGVESALAGGSRNPDAAPAIGAVDSEAPVSPAVELRTVAGVDVSPRPAGQPLQSGPAVPGLPGQPAQSVSGQPVLTFEQRAMAPNPAAVDSASKPELAAPVQSAGALAPHASSIEPASAMPAGSPLPASDLAAGAVRERVAAAAFDPNATRPLTADLPTNAAAAGLPEKFAAAGASFVPGAGLHRFSSAKQLLTADSKVAGKEAPGLGIGTAKPETTMAAGFTSPRSTTPAEGVSAPAVVSGGEVRPADLPQVALPTTAHRAVEAVLQATERFAARDQHSVNLQFNVGGSDLNVRVELRGNEVRTTFRTDSPELRAALSSEWQTVTTQSSAADRTIRLANPVFTSSDQNAMNFSGDGAASRHRDPQPQSSSGTFGSAHPFRGGASATTASGMDASVTPRTGNPGNSVHLHTLA